MKDYNIYRLKSGKKSGSWQLPIRSEMITKTIEGRDYAKRITYIPGSGTIFLEDYKGDQKQKRGIWFDEGEIAVPSANFELNEILQRHRLNNVAYELVDEEKSAKRDLVKYETVATASNMILSELDDDKLKAMAMILLGEEALNWGVQQSKGKLLQFANEHSQRFLYEVDKPNYQTRYLAAIAIAKGIVAMNTHHTAIVWGDDPNGKIISVAPGENGLEKLAEYLENESDGSTLVLQRIGEKIDKAGTSTKGKSQASSGKSEAQLRAELEAEYERKFKEKVAALNGQAQSSEIEQAREQYKAIKGKDVPVNKKNDLDWIQSEINQE